MNITEIDRSGNKFKDNDRYHDLDFTGSDREFKPHKPVQMDWRSILATGIIGLIVYIVLVIVYGIWKTIYCWDSAAYSMRCVTLTSIEPLYFIGSIVLAIGLLVWFLSIHIKTYEKQRTAYANRLNLVTNRFGDQEPADQYDRFSTEQTLNLLIQRYAMANTLQKHIAQHQIYKGVNTLSINQTVPSPIPAIEIETDQGLAPIDPDTWLNFIDHRPHVLLASETGEGKTVTAKRILADRIARNEELLIIDPHSDYWFDLPVFGGGENWHEVREVIYALYTLYRERLTFRDTYLKETGNALAANHFPRLTVLLDEAFIASKELKKSPKGVQSLWELFTEVFGSGARKVAISLMLISQSANCEDLDISGPMRQNFTRLALDTRAIKLMISQEELDQERKRQLYIAMQGLDYPATTVIKSRVELLDRKGIDVLPAHLPVARSWSFVRSDQGVQGHTPPTQTNERTNKDLLRALRLAGFSRDDARNQFGLHFTDEDWKLDQ